TCESIANKAGKAYCGGIVPAPIKVPTKTPTTCATAAPGPNKGDKKGKLQIIEISNNPHRDEPSGDITFAIQSPTPVYSTKATKILTNAIKGIIVFNSRSTVFRPESKNIDTTDPTADPILVIKLKIGLPFSSTSCVFSSVFCGSFSIFSFEEISAMFLSSNS